MLRRILNRIQRRVLNSLVTTRSRHGLELTMYIEFAPLDQSILWKHLEAALDLIAEHRPIWIRRMLQLQNSIHVRRIPGTRAELRDGRYTILDPYLLANFPPAQIAASIIHEAVHAKVRSRGLQFNPAAPGREEKACRAAELRFGHALKNAGVPGAESVIERAAAVLESSEEAGVVIDWQDLRAIRLVTRLKDYPLPFWWKRRLGRRWGVLDSPHWQRIMESDESAA